tara:strand:+ start:336 stop:617 length:282 start_codon:yes stop_codon:yes gene_type:complete
VRIRRCSPRKEGSIHKYIDEVDLLKFFEAHRIRPGFTIAVIGINDGLTSGGGDFQEEPIFEFLNKNVQGPAILIETTRFIFGNLKKKLSITPK